MDKQKRVVIPCRRKGPGRVLHWVCLIHVQYGAKHTFRAYLIVVEPFRHPFRLQKYISVFPKRQASTCTASLPITFSHLALHSMPLHPELDKKLSKTYEPKTSIDEVFKGYTSPSSPMSTVSR